MLSHTLRSLALGTGLALALTSAASAVTYHRGNDGDPETLDQHKTSTVAEANILRDMYEGLVVYDPEANVIPGVATEWTQSDDGLTYTFTLRDDAKWSNGDPVTAEDFVYSFRRIMAPETGAKYANILYPIKNAEAINEGEMEPEELGVTAVDEKTLEISLENPTPYFIELLTHQTGLPVHPASVEEHGTDFVRPENIVTNGAYTLESFTPQDRIVLEKNPEFHDAADVQIDEVVYYPIEDRASCVRRFEAGEIDSCSDLPTEQLPSLREKFGDQVKTPPYLGTYYLAVKSSKEPFDDPKVRRALSLTIDREFVADEIWSGSMSAAYAFVPPGIGNYGDPAYADYKDTPMLDREDEAKALLEEAGFTEDEPLEVEVAYNTSENHKNTVTAIADMWRGLGNVEVTMVNRDAASHFAHLRDKGDFDVARAGWIGDYSDPQNFLFMVESDNDGFNYADYANPEYDKLMEEAESETDLEKRAEILRRAEEIFIDDLPFIPVMYYSSHSLVSPRLEGWEDNIQNAHGTRFLKKNEG